MKRRSIRFRAALLMAGLVGVACAGRVASEADAGPADVERDYTLVGGYRCCVKGIGTDCCDGFPRNPATGATGCFQYGGLYGDCRAAGEIFEGKIICAHCCEGLQRSPMVGPGTAASPEIDRLPADCDSTGVPSTLVCIRCGDGVCGAGENFCNCAEDCPRPADAGADGG